MADPSDTAARTCIRCGCVITPRGGVPPRYCAVCGLRLTPLQEDVRQALSTKAKAPGTAVAALVLGICSLAPMCGLPLGLAAIAVGLSAVNRIKRSNGQLGGKGLAVAGVTLGIITSALWTLACLGAP